MRTLADGVVIAPRFARSANLERDLDQSEPLNGYMVTSRVLDAVERIATTAASGIAGGAWSITGPYGSGKSSLALLVDAAFGGPGSARDLALSLIAEVSPDVRASILKAHERHDTIDVGFHRGLVTAGREPISRTVLRALHTAILRRYGKIPSSRTFSAAPALKGALADASSDDPRRTGPSPAALVEVACALAEEAPLLLVVDEFGKNLEAIGDDHDSDPYLLQQLAEAGQGSGVPIFLLTLQHLSFEDYLAGVDDTQRKEWAKVQGRFEDVAFVESASQMRQLIGSAFTITDGNLSRSVRSWAEHLSESMKTLGMADLNDPAVIAACYPLHPVTAAVLPELCNRYGQHERTLFSYLTGSDRNSAASFLARTGLNRNRPLPTLGLDSLYDYFVASGSLATAAGSQSTRWTEISTRIRDIHGLSESQLGLAKAIAVLNLVATAGNLRASGDILRLVAAEAESDLAVLESRGVATYRNFADEYRIWQGTDVDISRLLDSAHAQIQRQSLVEVLGAVDEPQPVVAARHSAQNDVLRVFFRRYVDDNEQVQHLDPFSPFDGEVLLVVGPDGSLPRLAASDEFAKPTVAAVPDDLSEFRSAAREVAALINVLNDEAVVDDWVARRELGERLAQARAALDAASSVTFSADACQWFMVGPEGAEPLEPGRGSGPLSSAADRSYPHTPLVRNEMLNRTDVTSQGAKARRLLLEAMIESSDEPGLRLQGYGPEVAMYRAFLERTGLHGRDHRNETMVFRRPSDPSLEKAWAILEEEFKRAKRRRINLSDIYAALQSPPVGLKAGVVPVLVTAGLLAYKDEVAIYEHGTFKPVLSPDLSERMVRNPGHFDVKHFANSSGSRRQVIEAIADQLGLAPSFRKHRVANVLSIVGHLVSEVRHLDNYTIRTSTLSETTTRVRDALLTAIEPDELLFESLPMAFGFRPVPATTKTYSRASDFATGIHRALRELKGCFDTLLEDLLDDLLSSAAAEKRSDLVARASALNTEVLDPTIRAFILTLTNDTVDSDADWIKAIATVVAKKAPAEWQDEDRERFRHELPQQVAAFHRLAALHADQLAEGGGPFDAMRVIVTSPDGREQVRLVALDEAQREVLERHLAKLLDNSGLGQTADQALLALLAERILPEPAGEINEPLQVMEGKVQHG